jgi:hypothetical protein
MSLSGDRVSPQIAVSEMTRAEEFYEGQLGLIPAGVGHAPTRERLVLNGERPGAPPTAIAAAHSS